MPFHEFFDVEERSVPLLKALFKRNMDSLGLDGDFFLNGFTVRNR